MGIRGIARAARLAAALCCLGLLGAAPAAADFSFVAKWGSHGAENGQFNLPAGVATDAAGNVYVADSNNGRVQKFSGDGTWLQNFGQYGTDRLVAGQFNGVGGVAVDSAGNLFAVDVGNYRVHKFAPDGTPIAYFGPEDVPNRPGEQRFESNPQAIAVDSAGNVYVTDRYHVHKFGNDGRRLATWGASAAGSEPGQFDDPRGIAVDAQDNVFVTDGGNYRVQKLASDGRFLTQWGMLGAGDGQFQKPLGIAIAPNGNVYVGDDFRRDVQSFTPEGTFLSRNLEAPGADPDRFRPHGLAFDRQAHLFIVDTQVNVGSRVLKVRDEEPAAAPLPPPVPGKTVNIGVERGTVLVKFPRGRTPTAKLRGVRPAGGGFVRVTQSMQIPIGSIVDATRGRLGMTAAGVRGTTQNGSFFSGQFTIRQPRSASITELRLSQPLSCRSTRKGASKAARKARSRRLWANARGRFRTRGRRSAATIRGTLWLTRDTCTTTTTVVRQGTVIVRDFAKRKNIRVKKGRRYVARARGR